MTKWQKRFLLPPPGLTIVPAQVGGEVGRVVPDDGHRIPSLMLEHGNRHLFAALLSTRYMKGGWPGSTLIRRLFARGIPVGSDWLEWPEVPDIDEMKSATMPIPPLSVFTVETAAPTIRTVAAGHDRQGYGERSTDWRPFPHQDLSLAECASQVVEQLDFKAEISEISTAHDPYTRKPGIILIDPWFIAEENGRFALETAVENLPRWVMPLLVLDRPDDARTRELAEQVRDILDAAGALPTYPSQRGASGVKSLDGFLSIMGVLVAAAERQYLQRGSDPVPSPPVASAPRLGHAEPAGRIISMPDPLGETPDA
jgi:FxsC-like protein